MAVGMYVLLRSCFPSGGLVVFSQIYLRASLAQLKEERDGLIGELYYERRKQQETAEALQTVKNVCQKEVRKEACLSLSLS